MTDIGKQKKDGQTLMALYTRGLVECNACGPLVHLVSVKQG